MVAVVERDRALTETRSPWGRVFREPLVHFLLLGGLLFGLSSLRNPGDSGLPDADEILVSRGRIQQLSIGFERTWQRSPTRAELDGLIEDFVTEEILYREARAMGLDEDDTIIRRRLRQKMEFILDDLAAAPSASDADLATYLEDNREDFRADPILSFRQVYLDLDRFGADAGAAAERLLADLRLDDSDWESKGQTLRLLKRRHRDLPLAATRALFGETFADSAAAAPVGEWAGPVRSGYGLHLIFIDEREEPPEPTLEGVREAVAREWERERREEATTRALAAMREHYLIRVERAGPP